jgi:hypothetical protein
MKGRDHCGVTEVDGRIILKCILKMECEDVGLINLSQDRVLKQDSCQRGNDTSALHKRIQTS